MTWILAIIAAICAVGWVFSWLSFKTLAHYFKEKGYPMPEEKDIKRNSDSIIKEILSKLPVLFLLVPLNWRWQSALRLKRKKHQF